MSTKLNPRYMRLFAYVLQSSNPFRTPRQQLVQLTIVRYVLSPPGSTYAIGATYNLVDLVGFGTGARLQVDAVGDGVVARVTLSDGGSGYAPKDTASLLTGDGDARIRVDVTTPVAGGVALAYTLTDAGAGYKRGAIYRTRVRYGPGRGMALRVDGVNAKGGIVASTLYTGGLGGYAVGAPFRIPLRGTRHHALGVIEAATPLMGGAILALHLTRGGTSYDTGTVETANLRSTGQGLRLRIDEVRDDAITQSHLVAGGVSYRRFSTAQVAGGDGTARALITAVRRINDFRLSTTGRRPAPPVVVIGPGMILSASLVAGGAAYASGDTFRLLAGNNDALGTVDDATAIATGDGAVTACDIRSGSPGAGFLADRAYTTRAVKGPGTGLRLWVDSTEDGWIDTSHTLDGGAHYILGEPFRIRGGDNSAQGSVARVEPVSDTVQDYHLTQRGAGYRASPLALTAQTSTGVGAGLRLTIDSILNGVIVLHSLAIAGLGYQVGDRFRVSGGNGDAVGIVHALIPLSSGGVATYTLSKPGTGYETTLASATTLLPGHGRGCTFVIDAVHGSGAIMTATMEHAGSRYVSGDIVDIVRPDDPDGGPYMDVARFIVETIESDGGVLTGHRMDDGMGYSVSPDALKTQLEVRGSGFNLQIKIAKVVSGVIGHTTLVSGGSGYKEGDTFTLMGGYTGWTAHGVVDALIPDSGGHVVAYALSAHGSGYAAGLVYPTEPPAGPPGTGCTLHIDAIRNGVITDSVLLDGGSGYQVDETFHLTGGSQAASGVVKAVETRLPRTGIITDYRLTSHGAGYAADQRLDMLDSNGEGDGLQLTVTSIADGVVHGVTVVAPGSGYALKTRLRLLGGNEDAVGSVTALDDSDAGHVTQVSVRVRGSGYSAGATLDTQPADALGTGLRIKVDSVRQGVITESHVFDGGKGYVAGVNIRVLGGSVEAHGSIKEASLITSGRVTALHIQSTHRGTGYSTGDVEAQTIHGTGVGLQVHITTPA